MVPAETTSTAGTSELDRMRPFIQGWADELGLTTGQAVTRTAVRPAWTVTAEPVPGRADPEAGE